MPYGLVALVASVALALHHVAVTDPSRRSKLAVSIVVAASLAIGWSYPPWHVLAIVLQSAVGIYALVYLKANSHHA